MSDAPKALQPGGKWTALRPLRGAKHFEVLGVSKSGVELRCVVTGEKRLVASSLLEDREQWLMGWK